MSHIETAGGAVSGVGLAGPLRDTGTPLEKAVLAALDDLERALQLTPLRDNGFRGSNEASRFGRIFGGQLLGQAMHAATATVDDHMPHSLHAYFTASGDSDQPVDIAVERVRDGRSMAIRRVDIAQQGAGLFTAIASFHKNPAEPEVAQPVPSTPPPDEMPLLQHWAQQVPAEMQKRAQTWIDIPPPLEMRIAEAPVFMGGAPSSGPRAHWMRLPRDIGDRPALHNAMLVYASDYLLLDMAFRSHPRPVDYASFVGLSLDHAVWLHRPVRFDRWHVYTQEMVSFSGHRGLVRGAIHDQAGHMVASTAQEVLVRPLAGIT